jgi:hypothetical protein
LSLQMSGRAIKIVSGGSARAKGWKSFDHLHKVRFRSQSHMMLIMLK